MNWTFVVLIAISIGLFYFMLVQNQNQTKLVIESERVQFVQHEAVEQAPVRCEPIKLNQAVLDVLKGLQASVCRDHDWNSFMLLGDLYHAGDYPNYKPHEMLAKEIFRIGCSAPDPQLAALFKSRFNQVKLASVDIAESAKVLPGSYGQDACRCMIKVKQSRPVAQEPHRFKPAMTVPLPRAVPATRALMSPRARQIRGDSQNVHDSAVTRAVCKNVHTLQRNTNQVNTSHGDIVDSLSTTQLTASEMQNVKRVIQSLNTADHGTYRTSEQEALQMVWRTLQGIDDPKVRVNAIETLGRQLATAVERGNVVCSSGKIARIVSALDGIDDIKADPIVAVRPIAAVQDELHTLAAHIRTQVLRTAALDEQQAYNDGTDDVLSDTMKTQFALQATNVYCKELGIAPEVLHPLITLSSAAL